MFINDANRMTMDGRYPIPSGVIFEQPYRVVDMANPGKVKTVDSTGAFMVGELERLDQTLHEPLAEVSWGRDMPLREDVAIADEVSSFTLSTYGSTGSLGSGNSIGNGKAWVGKDSTQITGLSLDIAKIPHPLRSWAMELKYTILELESAAKLGRPIDQQKFDGLQLKHQMDIDEQVYYGDTVTGDTGLVNCVDVTNVNTLPAGAQGLLTWASKTTAEILADVNTALTSVWTASAFAVLPTRLLINTTNYGYIATEFVTAAGTQSILSYVLDNNLIKKNGRGALEIFPSKWCNGAGATGTIGNESTVNRMVCYTMDKRRVRFPMTLLQRTPVQYDGMYHKSVYFARIGVMEAVYPATLGYYDGL